MKGDNAGKASNTTPSPGHKLHAISATLESWSCESQEAPENLRMPLVRPCLRQKYRQACAWHFTGPSRAPEAVWKGWLGQAVSSLLCLFLTYFALIFPFATKRVWVTCLCDLYIKYNCSVWGGGCVHSCFFPFLLMKIGLFNMHWAPM